MKGTTHFSSGLCAAAGVFAVSVFVGGGPLAGGAAPALSAAQGAGRTASTMYTLQQAVGFSPQSLVLMAAGLLLGSVLPDIDSDTSTLGRLFPFISGPLHHRSLTHSLTFAAALLALGQYLPQFWQPFFFWLAAGCLLHIALDMFNPAGVPIIWPLRFRARFLMLHNIRSGGPTDIFLGRLFRFGAVLFTAGGVALCLDRIAQLF